MPNRPQIIQPLDVQIARAVTARAGAGQLRAETCTKAANLAVGYHIPVHRATLLPCQLAGITVSAGWMAGIRGKAARHLACTRYLTCMHTGDRSADAINAGGVLPGYQGVIVRDGYGGYSHLTDAPHAWCGVHLLPDLKGLYDFEPAQQQWASRTAGLLTEARDGCDVCFAGGQVRAGCGGGGAFMRNRESWWEGC